MKPSFMDFIKDVGPLIGIGLIGVLFFFFVCGCTLDVTHGDENSITHLEESRDRYIGDIYYAAVLEDDQLDAPIELPEDAFPVGTLTYEDYLLTLEGYDTHIAYEQEKIAGDEQREDD